MEEVHNAVRPHTRFAHRVADSRALQPRHEFVQTVLPATLCTIGIDVERAAVPDYPFRFDLKTLWVLITMTMDRNCSSYWNDAFLQACPLGSGRRGQCEIPDLPVRSAYFHGRVRSGQAKRSL